MAERIDLLFGLWPRVGWKKHKFNHIRQVVPMCLHEDTFAPASEHDWTVCLRWRYALCQISLTTCWGPFVKRFALCYWTVVLYVCSVYLEHWCIVTKWLDGSSPSYFWALIIMAALHSRCGHYIFVVFLFSVYHTSTHGVALVRI